MSSRSGLELASKGMKHRGVWEDIASFIERCLDSGANGPTPWSCSSHEEEFANSLDVPHWGGADGFGGMDEEIWECPGSYDWDDAYAQDISQMQPLWQGDGFRMQS